MYLVSNKYVSFLLVYGVTFLIVTLVFKLTAKTVYARLDDTRLQSVTALMSRGNLEQAGEELAVLEKSATADQEEVAKQREVWQRLQEDLLFAEEYYRNSGNTAKAEAVSRVLASYSTPKEMLVAVQLLLKQGETAYAKKLYDRAGRVAPDYIGFRALQEFFTN